MTVGREIQRLAVGMYERRLFVAGGIDFRTEVLGFCPVAFFVLGRIVDVGCWIVGVEADVAFAYAGEVEGFAVGRNRRLAFPGLNAVDVRTERLQFRPAVAHTG